MKSIAILTLAALLTGCAGAATQPRTAMTERARTASGAEELVLPSDAFVPPGTMSVSWTPPQRPALKQNEPSEMSVQPHFVSDKHRRGRLFALPTVYEH